MARGKKKTDEQKIKEMLVAIDKLKADEKEKQDVKNELADLLAGDLEPVRTDRDNAPREGRVLLGYHPVTGKPVYAD